MLFVVVFTLLHKEDVEREEAEAEAKSRDKTEGEGDGAKKEGEKGFQPGDDDLD